MRTFCTLSSLVLFIGCEGKIVSTPVDTNTDTATDVETIEDMDGDGIADDDDACPNDPLQWTDADEDGYCDEVDDACPFDVLQWIDTDGDGYCDDDDACLDDPLQWTDGDGDGNNNDNDDDNIETIELTHDLGCPCCDINSGKLPYITQFSNIQSNLPLYI